MIEDQEPKKTVDNYLNEVNYYELNHGKYIPSTFALKFTNFIQLVNGKNGESNKTPVVHLKMLDKIATKKSKLANLCARGMAKTTVFAEYLTLYLAVFGYIDNFGYLDSMLYVSDSMDNGVKSYRKNVEHRFYSSEYLQKNIIDFKPTDNMISFVSKNNKSFAVKMYGAKTGLRGTKIFGKRPVLAVLDDLVSDDDARSKVAMNAIKDTVYKGINYALDPTRNKIIFNGTPFNKDDVLYEAVESGAWDVNVWPICERFPCSKEDFNGAWEDRFTYDYVAEQYRTAKLTGKLNAFYQELMLRISSDEEKLINNFDIRWYDQENLLKHKSNFNFYITTDFATTDKQTSDYSVISVWAYNYNGDWFLVDGIAKKQTMDKSINDLFQFAVKYRPQSVGIETTGQQGAFINWFQTEMMNRNAWFNIASQNGKLGIRPTMNKFSRFNLVVPLFKAGKMFFPKNLKETTFIKIFLSQLDFVTVNGIKGHDDCLDTVSMLQYMNAFKPSEPIDFVKNPVNSVYESNFLNEYENSSSIDNYVV